MWTDWGPTTDLTIWVAVALAVLLTAAVPLLWDRGRIAAATRTGTVLLATCAVVATSGLVANRLGDFFPTWESIFGTDHSGLAAGTDGVTADAGKAQGNRAIERLLARDHTSARSGDGVVVKVLLVGHRSHISRYAAVYLPAAYFTPHPAALRFPVIEAFPTAPGTPATVLRIGLVRQLDALTAAGVMPPTIAVLPDPNPAVGRDSECVDAVHGGQDDTYLSTDVHADMVRDFPVRTDRLGWATIGFSTGGFCAVNLAIRHPQLYSSAVSESGYFQPLTDITTGNLYHGDNAVRDANDPLWMLQHRPQQPLSYLLIAGSLEHAAVADDEAFARAAHSPASAQTAVLDGYGHNKYGWNRMLGTTLPWLGTHLGGPVPARGDPKVRLSAPHRVRAADLPRTLG